MASTHDIGDSVRFSVSFTNSSGAAANPTTVKLVIKKPDGVETVYADATNSATGSYYRDLTMDQAGTWLWRWNGTGAVQASTEGFCKVRVSQFANPTP